MPSSGNQLPFTQPPPPADSQPSIEESLRDAETRPLDFPAAERAAYVRAMVKRAGELRAAGRTYPEIRSLLPEFARDYPYLFDMVALEATYDVNNLNTMLTMLDRMGQGSLNPHQATVIVGQRLAKKYFHGTGTGETPRGGQGS